MEEIRRHAGVERLRKVLMCDDEAAVDLAASIMASCSGSTAWLTGRGGERLREELGNWVGGGGGAMCKTALYT